MSGWGFDGSLGEARRKGPWRKLTSNPASSIFLGLSMGVASVLGAHAADLPSRKAAPVEYVRICDAYGSGFFFIPGTDTCLRVGGTVVAEWRAFSDSYRMSRALMGSGNIAAVANPYSFPRLGFVPSVGAYGNATGGNNQGFQGVGRIELDARTATPVGTLRTFVRIESLYASEGFFDTAGSLTGGANFAAGNYGNPTVFNSSARETTILNKAFIQFAGLTAGRVQSFFDFYTDEVNWEVLRGSNATVVRLIHRPLMAAFRDHCRSKTIRRAEPSLGRQSAISISARRPWRSWRGIRHNLFRHSRRLARSGNCWKSSLGPALGRSTSFGGGASAAHVPL